MAGHTEQLDTFVTVVKTGSFTAAARQLDVSVSAVAKAVARLGLATQMPPLRCDLFRPPPKAGDQLSLF